MSNLVPKKLTTAQKLARLRKAAKSGVDVREAPITATDLYQVQTFGTAAQKAVAKALTTQAERRHGK